MPPLIKKGYQGQIDDLVRHIIKLEMDMDAMAEAIKSNNETNRAILDAIKSTQEKING